MPVAYTIWGHKTAIHFLSMQCFSPHQPTLLLPFPLLLLLLPLLFLVLTLIIFGEWYKGKFFAARVSGRSLSGVAGSSPVRDMNVCLL
jgi:hypothetical protein